jgi:hypothetical protein
MAGNEISPGWDTPENAQPGDETPCPVGGSQVATIDNLSREELTPPEIIESECRTGSLLFSRGDCLAVRIYTGSGYTHVATVVSSDHEPFVYDSTSGAGVRKLPLEEYLATQRPDEVHLFHPRRTFTQEEARAFQAALEQQLGRPYSAKHHLTGRRNKGLHCSEYVTDALIAIDWLQAENPVKVSPASLLAGIVLHDVYRQGSTVELLQPVEPEMESESWCPRMWQDTKICTRNCCRQLSRWFLCR